MRAGLAFGGLGVGLLEESEDASRCFVIGIVEEGNDVFRAVLQLVS